MFNQQNKKYVQKIVTTAAIIMLASSLFSTPSRATSEIPTQQKNVTLYNQLPQEVREKGMVSAIDSSFYPYAIIGDDNKLEGAGIDFAKSVSEILGVEIRHEMVDGFSGMLMGIQGGKYQVTFNPIDDQIEREQKMDLLDIARGVNVVVAQKGKLTNITSFTDLCGKSAAVMKGATPEGVVSKHSGLCVKQGNKPIELQKYRDVPAAILAVLSGRADMVLLPMPHFAAQKNDQLELIAAINELDKELPEYYRGVVLGKDSVLTPVLLEAFKELYNNGTYAIIMKKWGLEKEMLAAPGVNLAGQ
ncbi:MAG: transporter substrate-binding domain-containing protein [Enterobacteriaceae bacterium]